MNVNHHRAHHPRHILRAMRAHFLPTRTQKVRYHRGMKPYFYASMLALVACTSAQSEPAPEASETPEAEASTPAIAELMPIVAGNTWTYKEVRHKGASMRLLGFANKPRTKTEIATITLAISAHPKRTDRFIATVTRNPTDGEPASVEQQVWQADGQVWMAGTLKRKPALIAKLPPSPVSWETVSCDVPILGIEGGTCAARAGGARGTTPGLQRAGGKDVSIGDAVQLIVGIATVGTIIPGNKDTWTTLEFGSFTHGDSTSNPAAVHEGPLVAAFRASPDPAGLPALMAQHGADLEDLATILKREARSAEARRQIVRAAAPSLDIPGRHTLLRLAMTEGPDPNLSTLAALIDTVPTPVPDPYRPFLVAEIDNFRHLDVAETVAKGNTPMLNAWLSSIDGGLEGDWLPALSAAAAAHPVTDAEARTALSVFTFDSGRLGGINAMLPHVPEEDRPRFACALIGTMQFDDNRLDAIAAHRGLLDRATLPERQALHATFTFKDGQEKAKALLNLP